ncbi:MAG: hypothetical protein LBK99_10995 [Opitutaceae bacterium]|jgi:hypothetical protein|nr:hypothetical protein [Opitutaceae bacterium]
MKIAMKNNRNNIMNTNITKTVTTLAMLLLLPSDYGMPSLSAATLVNWDGGVGGQNYVEGAGGRSTNLATSSGGFNINYGGDPEQTDRQGIRLFSTSSPLSPSAKYPNTVNPTQYSTTFYGAYEGIMLDATGGSAINQMTVRDADNLGAYINIQSNAGTSLSYDYTITTFLLFRKDDFLNTFDASTMRLDTFSATFANNNNKNIRVRWVVQNGSGYYISEQTNDAVNSGTISLADVTSTQWATYIPATAGGGAPLNYQPVSASFVAVNFNDVQGVGLYLETWDGTDQFISKGVTSGFALSDFIVTATTMIVPEPGACALLMATGMIILVMFRRYRHRI